ncbi:MAG TPA: sugar transferase [Candidatus Limnocylindrales bacterium]|nr:sugar transferase [Candidatus Limnocylindrales bacterium]
MIRRHITPFRLSLMAADGVSGALLFVGVSYARFGQTWPSSWRAAGVDPLMAAAAYGAVWVFVLWVLGMYRLRARWTVRTELIDVVRAAMLLAIATFTALFVLKLPNVSRLFLLWLFAAQIIVTVASRLALRSLIRGARDHGYMRRYMLIVGTSREARRFADRVERHRELGLRVIGHLATDPGAMAAADTGRPVLGTVEDIEQILHDRIVDEVAICLPPEWIGIVEPITRLCEEEGKIVRIPLMGHSMSLPGSRLEDFDGIPILSLVYGPDRVLGLIAKRLLDFVLAAAGLVLLSPILVGTAAAIMILDGRPIVFRQLRVGLNGRAFQVVKFRSMVPDAEARIVELEALNEISGPAFKLTRDPRLTRTGRFLRATSLDELPQLWNVLKGEMSLVGPRPPLPREVQSYQLWHRRRLSMKPGITGLWQVAARRESDFDRWVELDLSYIDHWSLWLDLKIMFRTIPAMIQGR